MNSLSLQKPLSHFSRLFKILVNMGGISRPVYLLDRDEAETKRYVFYSGHFTMSHLQIISRNLSNHL